MQVCQTQIAWMKATGRGVVLTERRNGPTRPINAATEDTPMRKKTNKTVYAVVFAAAAFFLVSVGGEAQPAAPEAPKAPFSLSKDIPAAPLKAHDLIA